MKNIFIILVFLQIISCKYDTTNTNNQMDDNNIVLKNKSNVIVQDSIFDKFLNNFDIIELPFSMEYGDDKYTTISMRPNEMDATFVKEHERFIKPIVYNIDYKNKDFFNDNEYYKIGRTIISDKYIILLICHVNYKNQGFGITYLSTFNLEGKLISTIEFEGSKGDDYTIVSNNINKEGLIEIKKITYQFEEEEIYRYKEIEEEIKYQIEKDGKIMEISRKVIRESSGVQSE